MDEDKKESEGAKGITLQQLMLNTKLKSQAMSHVKLVTEGKDCQRKGKFHPINSHGYQVETS